MCRFSVLVLMVIPGLASAQLSPQESLKTIKPRPGFKVELMAAEPLVMDPIAFAWGPDGKFWVVEMGDYPLGTDGKGKFGGKIKILTKSKPGDGPYDTAVTFMDNLGYPTGVMPWGKGVIVSCAPDIFYAEDTDGDGKADKKIVLFTGFGEGNQQHRVNGFTYGLDNWIYGANGDSGGRIRVVQPLTDGSSPQGKGEIDIRGRDFRFKVDGSFDAQSGQSQFGRHRDDWGNWFGNNNSNPMWHYVLEDHYQRRNPHLPSPDPRVNVSIKPGAAPVFPISKPLPRFNSPNALNHFTSACSAIVYRDDLFGSEFVNNTFVSEPVHNLVHREVMKPKGITFTSQRAPDEQTSEFLASTDNWFRPAMIQTGPDGALWVADMYRYVIEHPQWIPIDWQKKLDLRAGHDKGRIYRVYPENKKPREIPRLDKMITAELVAALDSPSGWQRDMSQMLLVRQRDPKALDLLDHMFIKSKNPLACLHVLCTLDGLGSDSLLLVGLNDPHPGVRRHAVRIFERALSHLAKGVALADHADPQVRLQTAYSLGASNDPVAGETLGRLAVREAKDKYFLAAIFSSVNQTNFDAVVRGALKEPTPPAVVLENLLRLSTAYGSTKSSALILSAVLNDKAEPAARFTQVANLLDALESQRSFFAKLAANEEKNIVISLKQLDAAISTARAVAKDAKAQASDRALAVRLLGRGLNPKKDDLVILAGMLSPQTSEELQSAAIVALGKLRDPSISDILLKNWRSLLPTQRNQVVDVFLARQDLLPSALVALEKKQIAPLEIDAARRQQLLDHKNALVRARARKVFAGAVDADRARVIEAHKPVVAMKGEAKSGAKVFTKTCAACHQLAGVGQQVGPDLASVKDKTPDGLLIAILDPNRAVEARYVNYSLVTKSGLTYSGLLASETGTSITLVGVDGKKHTVLRTEVDELYSTGKSAMPDGLEKDLSHQDLADLIAFLRQNLPALGRKTFVGNEPNWVRNGQDGTLHLTAKNCEIYGSTLVLEPQYGNLGYWSSADDRAVWQLELSKAGRYAVWLDWACDPSSAGNSFILQVADQKVTGKVESTGSWDNYRQVKIGEIDLAVGRQEFSMQAASSIRGALIDLREIKLVPIK